MSDDITQKILQKHVERGARVTSGLVSESALCLELDDNGYPTDDSLEQIKKYKGDYQELMKEMSFLFDNYGRCELEDNIWKVATGGWSGCESVIGALKENTMFWLM